MITKNNYIYVDSISPMSLAHISANIPVSIITRSEPWSFDGFTIMLTDPHLLLVIINKLSTTSIMEIPLSVFMYKPVVVFDSSVCEFEDLKRIVTFEKSCNMDSDPNGFVSWFEYWKENICCIQ